jgi:hypothetical protein
MSGTRCSSSDRARIVWSMEIGAGFGNPMSRPERIATPLTCVRKASVTSLRPAKKTPAAAVRWGEVAAEPNESENLATRQFCGRASRPL